MYVCVIVYGWYHDILAGLLFFIEIPRIAGSSQPVSKGIVSVFERYTYSLRNRIGDEYRPTVKYIQQTAATHTDSIEGFNHKFQI